jgi:hypothetical protein
MVHPGCPSASSGFQLDREISCTASHEEHSNAAWVNEVKMARNDDRRNCSPAGLPAGQRNARDEPNSIGEPARRLLPDNGGITLPTGFCAMIFADGIGHARQLVVAPEGTVYVNSYGWEAEMIRALVRPLYARLQICKA